MAGNEENPRISNEEEEENSGFGSRLFFRERKVGTSLVVQWLRTACQCREYRFHPWSRKIPYAVG